MGVLVIVLNVLVIVFVALVTIQEWRENRVRIKRAEIEKQTAAVIHEHTASFAGETEVIETNAEFVKRMLEKAGYAVDIEWMKSKCIPQKSDVFRPEGRSCKENDRCSDCANWWNEIHKCERGKNEN